MAPHAAPSQLPHLSRASQRPPSHCPSPTPQILSPMPSPLPAGQPLHPLPLSWHTRLSPVIFLKCQSGHVSLGCTVSHPDLVLCYTNSFLTRVPPTALFLFHLALLQAGSSMESQSGCQLSIIPELFQKLPKNMKDVCLRDAQGCQARRLQRREGWSRGRPSARFYLQAVLGMVYKWQNPCPWRLPFSW